MNEHQHQCAFFKWFKSQYPGVLAFAIPNAAKRGPRLASMMKSEGMLAGMPDLMIADGKPGLFIEMKTPKGRMQPNQHEIIGKLAMAGYFVAICYGWEQAKEVTQQYLTKGNKC